MTPAVHRDERTLVVENASYRWAYLVFSYGLLVIIMYRAYVHNETSVDLWALLFVGGAVSGLYQFSQGVLTKRWTVTVVVSMAVAAVVAAAFAAFMVWMR